MSELRCNKCGSGVGGGSGAAGGPEKQRSRWRFSRDKCGYPGLNELVLVVRERRRWAVALLSLAVAVAFGSGVRSRLWAA